MFVIIYYSSNIDDIVMEPVSNSTSAVAASEITKELELENTVRTGHG